MSYQIVENDVRLLRRILVCLQLNQINNANVIKEHLRAKGLHFVLPNEQQPGERVRYYPLMTQDEIGLSEAFGCVLLPEHHDLIFLNHKWINPKTLYVRLVEPVPELGALGAVYWSPDNSNLDAENEAYLERRRVKTQKGFVKGVLEKVYKVLGR